MMSGVLPSHTATQQWQSFEVRMRRRRIERCMLRASVAIEAGVLEDAREALEEVQRLDPREPSIETLNAQLDSSIEPRLLPPRVGEVPHSLADISLARDVLGYEPSVGFEAGLKRTIGWLSGDEAEAALSA